MERIRGRSELLAAHPCAAAATVALCAYTGGALMARRDRAGSGCARRRDGIGAAASFAVGAAVAAATIAQDHRRRLRTGMVDPAPSGMVHLT